MDADQIEEQLLLELRVQKGNEVFTGDSAVDLFLLIRDGAKRMATEGSTSDDDLQRAAEQLRRFLAEMETERVRLGLSEFHEETVSGAQLNLGCPGFWPFC